MEIASIDIKPDLTDRVAIESMVEGFYAKVLSDPILAPVFLEVAHIRIDEHLPRIVDYWSKMLHADKAYKRNTIAIHRDLHKKQAFRRMHYEQWLRLFLSNLDEQFDGPYTEKARRIARNVINNMQQHFV